MEIRPVADPNHLADKAYRQFPIIQKNLLGILDAKCGAPCIEVRFQYFGDIFIQEFPGCI
jgi:hypothetical protein